PPLESSPSLCRLLRYVVEETLAGRNTTLKEYSLGVEVFGRGEAFDPRMDPIVRVQARNLRVRMAQYYEGAGASDTLLIELPKRTYVPVFRVRNGVEAPAVETPVEAAAESATPSSAVIVETAPPADLPAVVGPSVVVEAAAPAPHGSVQRWLAI